ncbi:MAG: Ig-like domain-containing protein, partial [Pseudomonadota bacterium]|nr:Ig-like domain-containing protein [Pseudomonadota bacterium]
MFKFRYALGNDDYLALETKLMVFSKENQKYIPNIATDTLATLPALASSADAAFVRVDNDLVINILGDSLTFSDYFLKPVAFKTAEGSVISVADVFTWVNSHTPSIQVAANGLVTPQAQLEKIGSVTALVEGPITAQNSASGKSRTLTEGDAIYLHDTLSTAANSHVKITLNDGTVLQFGPLSRAKLDKYTYDAQAQEGEFETSVFVGLFRYISGKLSGNDGQQHTTIKTPSANIGIRGSEIEAFIEDNGSTTILHKTGLIDIQSLYGAEKITVFQPNTKIYVPVGATFTDVEQLTPEQARQFQELFLPLDSQTEDSQAQPPAKRSSDDQQESADDSELDILSPDVGGRNPFSPLLLDEERFKEEFESVRSEPQAVGTQPQLGAELALGAASLQTPETAFTTLPPTTVIDQAPIAEDDGPFDISGQNSITLAATTLLANDQDPEGEPLNLTGQFSQVVNGTVRLTAEGDVVFTRTSDFSDHGSFRYEVSDTQGNVASAQVTMSAEPFVPDVLMTLTLNEDNAQRIPVADQVTALTQPTAGQVYYHQDGYLVYTPNTDFQGQDQFSYRLNGQEVVETVTVKPLTMKYWSSVTGGEVVQLTQPEHGHVTDFGQGVLTYTPEPNFYGEDQFTVTIKSQNAFISARTVGELSTNFQVTLKVIAVNDAPQTQADNATTAEDTALVISSDTLLANDSDVEGEPLQIIQLNPSFDPQTEANLTQGRLELSNGQIHYQPATDFYGQAEFNYTVVDAEGAQSQGQVNVTVTAVNDAPVAVDDSRVWEGEPLTLTPAALLANDRDVDPGDTLTMSQVTNARNGNVSFNGNTISFTLNAGANQGGFDYEISDGAEQDRAQVTVVRRPETGVNQAPVAADDSFSVTQNNAPIRLSAAQLLSNDSDADNDVLTLTAVQPQLNAQVTLANNGDVIVTPNASFAEQGFGRFGYEIQDTAGLSSNATVTITFANQAPIARNDSIALTTIEPVTLSASQLLSNDSDPNNDPLTLVSVTAGPHVQVSLENNQTILLTPEATLTDTGSFSYVISDAQGNTASATVQLSAPAAEPNAPPIAQDDTLVLNQAEAASVITVAQLLSNDSDPEQDTLTLTQLSAPIAGEVDLTPEGEIIFTPQAEFATSGLGGFSYEITDNHGNTAQAQVTLRFTEDNLPPIAEADLIIVTDPTATLNIAPATLLANDHDPNGDSVQITQVMNSQQGFITLAQQLEFTPTAEFASTGRAGFSYELSDTQGATTTAEVTLQLFAAQADGPVHMGAQQQITLTAEELLSNDYFPQAQPPTLTLVADSAVNGNATLTAAGDIVFSRNSDFATQGLGSFRYQLSDQQGHVTTAEVTLIGDVAPTANAYATTTFKNTPLNLSLDTLLAQIKDPNLPNDSHQVTAVSATETGSVELDPVNNQLLYTPADNFTGTVNLTYTVTDSQGLSVEAPLTITVDNRAPEATDDNLSTVRDQPLTISVAEDLLANDQDADPGDTAALAFQVQTDTVTHGQLEVDDPVLVFTPEAGFEG